MVAEVTGKLQTKSVAERSRRCRKLWDLSLTDIFKICMMKINIENIILDIFTEF